MRALILDDILELLYQILVLIDLDTRFSILLMSEIDYLEHLLDLLIPKFYLLLSLCL